MATQAKSAPAPKEATRQSRPAKPLPCLHCPVKAFNVCRVLEYDRQRELFELGVQQTWKRRQFLFRAGDPVRAVFKIISGMVAVSKPLADGRRQVLDFFLPGELCGYLQVDGRYAFDGTAITEVRTCSFNRRRFDAFAVAHQDVATVIKETLEGKLHHVSHHMAVVGQLTSTERVANFLGHLSIAYSEHAMQTRPLLLPMSRADIADYLGLRLETVSRAFSKLRKKGLLEFEEDRIIVHDPVRLIGDAQ
jgi:CRP/FNR family transcriptional regulator